MNQKQLANVLIKILGLSFCVDGVIRMVSGILNLLGMFTSRSSLGSSYYWVTPFSGLLLAAIGFLLIVLSKTVADLLLKDE